MKSGLGKLGGMLGIAYCLAGVALVFLGWNGAASYDSISAQFPYLISGGLAGLSLVVIGAALMLAQRQREDRTALQGTIDELRAAVERMGAAAPPASVTGAPVEVGSSVLAGPNAYHLATCRVIQGQAGLVPMTMSAATSSGRVACRVCAPEAA